MAITVSGGNGTETFELRSGSEDQVLSDHGGDWYFDYAGGEEDDGIKVE
jgi:hypothetical protein